jgi:hypothetical protein
MPGMKMAFIDDFQRLRGKGLLHFLFQLGDQGSLVAHFGKSNFWFMAGLLYNNRL